MGLGGLFFKVIDLPRAIFFSQHNMGFSGSSVVQNLPAKQETPVQSLGQEDPLEKQMATQYSCLENPMGRGTSWAIYRPWSRRV